MPDPGQDEPLDVVQHPTLGELKFPHSMPPEERNASIARLEAQGGKTSAYSSAPPPAFVGDIGTGIAKGAGNTVHGVGTLLNKIPVVGKYLAPKEGLDALDNMTRPTNVPQKVGYYGEQAGEYMLPGPAEGKAGLKAAELLPKLGKAAPVIGRLAASTASNAVINKVQGGSATEGAIGGLGGGIIGEGGRAIAPAIAESALGITKRMRGYGKTPGAAVLDEIKGIRPDTIFKNASAKSNALSREVEAMAAQHPGMIDMRPAIGVVDAAKAKTLGQNYAVGGLDNVRDQLTKRVGSGIPIAADQSATNALALKRGLRSNFVTNWNPEMHTLVPDTAKKGARAIDIELDNALGPKFRDLNQRTSSIIPVAERAESLTRNAPIAQRTLDRFGRHTGALAGALVGGGEGYREGGLKGGIIGATAGLALPEVIASPAFQMFGARALRSGIPIKPVVGAALQTRRSPRKEPSEKEDDE